MKKIVFLLIMILIVAIFSLVQAEEDLSYETVVRNLDLSRNTSLHVKMYWEQVRDAPVSWKGVVKDVRGGRGRAEIFVANSAEQTYKGYNIVLNSFDLEASAKLSIGDKITFTGRLQNYKGKKGRPVIIYLTEAQVL